MNVLDSLVLFNSAITDSVRDCVHAPSLESWSLFLHLQVLHSVKLGEHGGQFWSGLSQHTMARCFIVSCHTIFNTIFGAARDAGILSFVLFPLGTES